MSERGSVTFWLLGLAFALMSLGVLSVDLWSLIAERRELAGLADASAIAAASAIDEGEWRRSQELVLDRDEAVRRAWDVVASADELEPTITFDSDGVTVVVSVTRTVETALLALAGRDLVTVSAASRATATLGD
ncbi:MAG: pilus assembly protein TadG-related protein [Acidimicrobiia bacterium]